MTWKAKLLLAACATALMVSVYPEPAPADAATSTDAYFHEIELAEHAAMLVERMAKEAALISLEIEVADNLKHLKESHDEFARILKGLRHGDKELKLPGMMSDKGLRKKVEKVEKLWPVLDEEIKQVLAAGAAERDILEHLETDDEHLYQALEELEHALVKASDGDFVTAEGLNVTEHLATLIERMSKEYILIAASFQDAEMKADLAKTIGEFEKGLDAVVNGNLDMAILPAPTAELEASLKKVGSMWKKLNPVFAPVAGGAKPTPGGMTTVMAESVKIVTEIEKAALLYEAL